MNSWSFDITRQSGWDLWVVVCAAASLVLISYALFGRLWEKGVRGFAALILIAVGVGGTAVIAALPPLHAAKLGMVWTFAVLALLAATFYLNLLDRLGIRRTAVLYSIRVIALALLVPMLFEPVIRYVSRPKPERQVLFVVDTSGSMSFPDVQNGPTRIQSVWQTLRPQLEKINTNFVPRYFTFSTGFDELKKADDLASLQANGKATDIVNGIKNVLAQSTRPDTAVVLISDGIDNSSPDVVDAIRASAHPINTVRVGSELTEPGNLVNIAVTDVDAADDFVVGHETQVKVRIKSTALANRVIDVKLAEVDAAGKPMGTPVTQKLVLQSVADGQTVQLPYKPSSVGVHKLAVWVDPVAGERNVIDNRQEFQGLALDPRIKVLYIEGRLRPEYRELYRMLGHDPNVELGTLLRIQKDRFSASGTVDQAPLQGMPSSAEEWKKFDVVILGDLDSSFLPPDRQQAIEQLTSNGGGLLMVGGQNSLGPGGYKGTLIEKALPVMVGELGSSQEKEEFVPRLTAEGIPHPAMQGLIDWFGSIDKPGAKSLPPVRGNVVVPQGKSGAQVLLVHPGRPGPDGKPQIVLAVERYGKGRSAVFTVDTTYLWALPMYGMGQDSPYNRFWGQLVRWLAGTDVRNRQHGAGVEGLLNKTVYDMGESVRVRAMVRDERGDATNYAQVALHLKRPGGKDAQGLSLSPVEGHTGMYDLVIPHPDKGDWTAELIAKKDNKELGRQELKFTVIPPADEMLKIAANPELLSAIARETGGSPYDLAGLPTLIDQLIRSDKNAVTVKQTSVPLGNALHAGLALIGHNPNWPKTWDLPMQGLLVVILLTAEWIMRRQWQLN